MKLYHAPVTRSFRILWLLEELELPYELHSMDRAAGETKNPAYLAISPLGKVPALEDEGVVLWESGAIGEYLCERYGEGRLLPPPGTLEKACCLQWVHWAETCMVPLATMAAHRALLPEEKRSPAMLETARGALQPYLDILEATLSKTDYLTGGTFTLGDIMVGYNVLLARLFGEMSDRRPAVNAYYDRLKAREAFKRARQT